MSIKQRLAVIRATAVSDIDSTADDLVFQLHVKRGPTLGARPEVLEIIHALLDDIEALEEALDQAHSDLDELRKFEFQVRAAFHPALSTPLNPTDGAVLLNPMCGSVLLNPEPAAALEPVAKPARKRAPKGPA